MSISSRITSIEEHLKESYQELEGIGIDTTGVNNNLENIPKLLDGYWETLPKVTDEGTSITLDNTKEGKMKVLLKGNTSQETTSGKNILDITTSQTTVGGIPISVEDGVIKLNGTTSSSIANWYCRVFQTNSGNAIFSLEVTGYTDKDGNNASLLVQQNTENASTGWTTLGEINLKSNQPKQVSVTLDNTKYYRVRLFTSENTFTNATIKAQLEYGTTKTDWEKFTYGASPNPDYPQDIHTVSGDNTIINTGENLFGLKQWLDYFGATYTENSDGSITFQVQTNLYNTTYPIKSTDRCLWSFKGTNGTGGNFRFRFVYEDGYINETAGTGTGTSEVSVSTSSSTGHGNVVGIRSNWTTAGTFTVKDCMLEQYVYGVSPREYKPYVYSSYQVNLPVENILPINQITSQTINGLTITNLEDGTIKVNGTTNATTRLDVTYSKTLKANTTYTWHNFNTRSSGANVNIQDSSDNVLSNIVLNASSGTYTPTTNVTIAKMRFYIDSNQAFDNYILKVQLEEGTKQNSFTPYGTTPIELCKIGTYQDKIDKSSGKNLINLQATQVKRKNAIYSNIVATNNTLSYSCTSNASGYLGYVIPIEIGKQYVLSYSNLTGGTYVGVYIIELDNAITEVGTNYGAERANGYSFTATKSYLGIWLKCDKDTTSSVSNLMLNEGTTALPYEPYGDGDWYLNKQIGKVVLDGSEGWTSYTDLGTNARMYYQLGNILYRSPGYSNYFSVSSNWTDDITNVCLTPYQASLVAIKMPKSYLTTTDLQGMKNWLGTHNTTVYYVLATPTYTKIEGTLASQLEALNGSKSYTPQTNISQDNNDMASVLNATALSE